MRVQLALNSRRICECDITGTMTPETKDALKKFQKAQGLNVTGKMDTETLNRLGVALP
jgi:peptidoglycan hydrolase-like protein with peptidoglycan-binding domain